MKVLISESHLSRLLSEDMLFLFSNAQLIEDREDDCMVAVKFDYIDDNNSKIFSYDFNIYIKKPFASIEQAVWKLVMVDPEYKTFGYDDPEAMVTRINWLFKQGDVKKEVLFAIENGMRHKRRVNENAFEKKPFILNDVIEKTKNKLFLFSSAEITFSSVIGCVIKLGISYMDETTEEIEDFVFDIDVERGKRINKIRIYKPFDIVLERHTLDFVGIYNWIFEQGDVYQTFMRAVERWKNIGVNENRTYGNYTKKDILTIMENEGENQENKNSGKTGDWDYILKLNEVADGNFRFILKIGYNLLDGDFNEYEIVGEYYRKENMFGEFFTIDVINEIFPEEKELTIENVMWDYIMEHFEYKIGEMLHLEGVFDEEQWSSYDDD